MNLEHLLHNKLKKTKGTLRSVTNLVIEEIRNRDEKLLEEDLSFSNLQEEISKETEAPRKNIQCDWLNSRI